MKRQSQMQWFQCLFIASFSLFLASCARPANPNGGPVDEDPPKMLSEGSTPNYQTRFTDREIILEFDEFISLTNASKQIVISPPFVDYLKYTVRGKKLIIEFPENEELRKDATYQINFGEAIKDYTAGNALENFTFVFSTGDIIDSLKVEGFVYDAASWEPSDETLVLLYDNLSDTAFQTEKPFYFAKTDATGKFEIKNIKSDTFQVFALLDANLSLTYDLQTESIAFLDTTIILPDTLLQSLNLYLFDEREIPVGQDLSQKKKEKAVLNFSGAPRGMKMEADDSSSVKLYYELQEDSCLIWYSTERDSFDFFAAWEGVRDTFTIKRINKKKKASNLVCKSCRDAFELFSGDTLTLEFNKPIESCDINKYIQVDSLDQYVGSLQEIDGRFVKLTGKVADTGIYELNLLPDFVTDVFGGTIDSTYVDIEGKSSKVLGNIKIIIENVDTTKYYIYELLDTKDKLIASRHMRADSVLIFDRIPGDQYFLKVTEDLDGNGYWDSGNMSKKLYSEKIRTFQLEVLRQGWDLETSINFENEF